MGVNPNDEPRDPEAARIGGNGGARIRERNSTGDVRVLPLPFQLLLLFVPLGVFDEEELP